MTNDTQAPMLLGISGSLLLIALLLISARIWSRMRPTPKLHADDWTAIAATVLASAKYVVVCLACSYGFGRRAEFVSPGSRVSAMRLIFICQVIWYWSIALVKISVALLLLRIKPSRAWRIFLYGTIVMLLVTAVVQTCFQFLQCRPFKSYWDPSAFITGRVRCIPPNAITGNIIAGSAVHISTDLIYSFIPIAFIRKLNRPRGEKIFLGVLMGLGLFASTFAFLRTVGINKFYASQDIFRISVMPTLWAMLEQEVALIAATIPTLKNFMQRSLIKLGQSFYDAESETQVRDRLVGMGFLETGPSTTKRKPSAPEVDVATFGSPVRNRGRKDEYGDTVQETKEVVMMKSMVLNLA